MIYIILTTPKTVNWKAGYKGKTNLKMLPLIFVQIKSLFLLLISLEEYFYIYITSKCWKKNVIENSHLHLNRKIVWYIVCGLKRLNFVDRRSYVNFIAAGYTIYNLHLTAEVLY